MTLYSTWRITIASKVPPFLVVKNTTVNSRLLHGEIVNIVSKTCQISVQVQLSYIIKWYNYLQSLVWGKVHFLRRSDLCITFEAGFRLYVCLVDVSSVSAVIVKQNSHGQYEPLGESFNSLCRCLNGSSLVVFVVLRNQATFYGIPLLVGFMR